MHCPGACICHDAITTQWDVGPFTSTITFTQALEPHSRRVSVCVHLDAVHLSLVHHFHGKEAARLPYTSRRSAQPEDAYVALDKHLVHIFTPISCIRAVPLSPRILHVRRCLSRHDTTVNRRQRLIIVYLISPSGSACSETVHVGIAVRLGVLDGRQDVAGVSSQTQQLSSCLRCDFVSATCSGGVACK